ncbi:hypothetical protein [Vibrio mimicus]|uniref:GapS4b family protein n=1 Tax=Vibrio mimicus TaxID=674 RepID=UPI000878ABF8|nr:hypothetical protein [Vibrio mimicus]EKO3441358.1 hypothetical protein [Vibrio fluvialis]EKO3890402.1 hypothetical protein [Vibrio metschnikovii]HDZ3699754.1 hypothetical protein [Vibrio vulnificus]AOW83637.1 hypothetical protein VM_13350 [Vibrio mimicus]EKO3445150.1 hypothetical protein [Vibrio fluvialis]
MANNNFIPWGESLKDLVSQTKCTPSVINSLLRERGVFCSSSDKINTVPNLITSLLSPEESYDLLGSIKTKEKLDRVNFRNYEMKEDSDLLDLVSGLMEADDLQTNDYVNYQISDFNDFTSLDGNSTNALVLDFEVCRTDLLDGWYEAKKFFKGSVELKKDIGGQEGSEITMSVKLNHSSPETKEIADRVITIVERSLVESKIIDLPKQGGRVLFDDFENEDRVKFLNDLASQHLSYDFYYKKIDDVHFNPDTELETDHLQEEANLLEKDIEQYRVKGNLEKIITVKWKRIHPYIKVTKVVASYTIDYKSYSGECKVSYEFSDYAKRKLINPELCINFINLKLKGASATVMSEVQSIIMREIETRKTELLKKYKKTTSSN